MSNEPTPAEILARAREVYATCRTYQDRGVVVSRTVHLDDGRQHTSKKPFTTAFVRPDRFRFEWATQDVGPEEEWDRMLILWNADGVRSWWTIQPSIRAHDSVHDAISCANGVSSVSAYTLPTLLIPGGAGLDPFPAPESATARGREHVNGHECFGLGDKDRGGGTRVLWFGCDDYLLRRIDQEQTFDDEVIARLRKQMEEHLKAASSEEARRSHTRAIEHFERSRPKAFRTETVTTYEPVVDAPIEPQRFEAPSAWSDPDAAVISAGAKVRPILALAPGESSPSVAETLARVRSIYGACRSYRDTGVAKTVFIHDKPRPSRRTVKKAFATAFVRPESFRFEYSEATVDLDDERQRMLVLWNSEGLRSWRTIRPGIRKHESLLDAIGHAAGASDGSAGLVPCLLLPCGDDRDPLPADATTALLGTESFAGHDCFVLRGVVRRALRDFERTLWIGRSDCLIRRIEETHIFDAQWDEQMRLTTEEALKRSMPEEQRKVMQRSLEHRSRQQEPWRTETTFTFAPVLDPEIPPETFASPKA